MSVHQKATDPPRYLRLKDGGLGVLGPESVVKAGEWTADGRKQVWTVISRFRGLCLARVTEVAVE